jgi:hypothetical protein
VQLLSSLYQQYLRTKLQLQQPTSSTCNSTHALPLE